MSGFFELPVPPPRPEEPPRGEWFGPPDNALGVLVPLEVVLARTDELALAVRGVTGYATGAEFDVVLLLRERQVDPFGWHPFHPRTRGAETPPDVLRLGVQFSDGAKATSLDFPRFALDPGEEPRGPVLMPRGGGGGDRRWDFSFWLWPLPPPGPLAFVCEWPAKGVELRRVEVDSRPLLDAAARSAPLWPDGEPDEGGDFSSVSTYPR